MAQPICENCRYHLDVFRGDFRADDTYFDIVETCEIECPNCKSKLLIKKKTIVDYETEVIID